MCFTVTMSIEKYHVPTALSDCLTKFVPWNNPRGCVTLTPKPSTTTTKIPEIKTGIEQKEDRKNNEKSG